MNAYERDCQQWLIRRARHFLILAMRAREAGNLDNARELLKNARKAADAAERVDV